MCKRRNFHYILSILFVFLLFFFLFSDFNSNYLNRLDFLSYKLDIKSNQGKLKNVEIENQEKQISENEKFDEIINNQSATIFYKKLANSFNSDHQENSHLQPQVFSAFAYSNHFSVILSTRTSIGSRVFCRYIGENGEEISEAVESVIYPLFVVYCSRRRNILKLAVTFASKDVLTDKNTKKILQRTFQKYQHNLTFCGAPIYGNEPKWLHIVELIEHYKLQGVQFFTFYIQNINEYDLKLLKNYEQNEEIEIIYLKKTNYDVITQQIMAISDCLLRNRKISKWSIFADIDERLLMTNETNTIEQFLRNINDSTIGSISFPQRWIMKRKKLPSKFENDQQIIESMPTRIWKETSSAAIKGHSVCINEQENCWAKNIVFNEKVIRMLVHEVQQFYPGFKQIFLNSSIGYIRHYRDVEMQSWEIKNKQKILKFGSFSNTSYPFHLAQKLLQNVLNRLHQVYS